MEPAALDLYDGQEGFIISHQFQMQNLS